MTSASLWDLSVMGRMTALTAQKNKEPLVCRVIVYVALFINLNYVDIFAVTFQKHLCPENWFKVGHININIQKQKDITGNKTYCNCSSAEQLLKPLGGHIVQCKT